MNEEKFQLKMVLVGLAVIVSAVLASSTGFAATGSANTTINANIGSAISVTNSASASGLNVTVTPSASGARLSSNADTVTVSTNNSTGYDLTLQMSTTDTGLKSGSNSISASGATQASPAVLSDNSWGYRVDGFGGFGSGTTTAETNADASTTTWAGVPAQGSPVVIASNTTAVSAEQTKVWYAIKVNTSTPTGIYSGVVTYTATTR